jgi:23S rRNA (guanine745-N1)-methyltransferase
LGAPAAARRGRTLRLTRYEGSHSWYNDQRLSPVLLCPVHDCHLPLAAGEGRLACPRAHSFDRARSGYVNLLLAQDRRARQPGDSAVTVAARRRFLARGFSAPIDEALVDMLPLAADDAVLDAGCGEGHHLAALVARYGCEGHGTDISVAAIDAAAKRHPALHWVVANADRFLPYGAASFRAVTSITARLNPGEFRRVLRDDGTLLVAVPGADDVIELRAAILGEGVPRERAERTIATFAPHFTLVDRRRIAHVARLDRPAIADVMATAYRALRTRERARLETLDDLDVTLSRDVLLFRPA